MSLLPEDFILMKKITPESQEKFAIKQYLTLARAFYFHLLQGLGCYAGAPDLIAAKDGKVYAIEVKVGKNKQSLAQKEFQNNWEDRGGIYICGGLNEVIDKISL